MVYVYYNKRNHQLTELGKYLLSNSVNKADVYYKTGIEESRLSLLSNDLSTLLYADEFYLIAKAIGVDLNEMLSKVFKGIAPKIITRQPSKELTRLGNYVFSYLNTKKDFAETANIQQARFSKLLNDPGKRPYAVEIYSIALLTNNKPSELFLKLYEDLTLNSDKKQLELKEASKRNRISKL